jgi:hypothetical protein
MNAPGNNLAPGLPSPEKQLLLRLDEAAGIVGEKVFQALQLFSAEELRDDPAIILGFSSLVSSLCRLNDRALKNQQYRDSQEPAQAKSRKRKKGMPRELLGNIQNQLNLL